MEYSTLRPFGFQCFHGTIKCYNDVFAFIFDLSCFFSYSLITCLCSAYLWSKYNMSWEVFFWSFLKVISLFLVSVWMCLFWIEGSFILPFFEDLVCALTSESSLSSMPITRRFGLFVVPKTFYKFIQFFVCSLFICFSFLNILSLCGLIPLLNFEVLIFWLLFDPF